MNTKITLLLLVFWATSCQEKNSPEQGFKIVIESNSDISCGLPVIRFLDRAAEVKARTQLETLTYNAYSLDTSLNVEGEVLLIEFTPVQEKDFRPCLSIGISYPGISILNARLVD